MRFDVITLFPELITPFLETGVTRRAFENKAIMDVRLWSLRDYALGNYRRVDDRPFGGGPGMLLMAEPLRLCLEAIESDRGNKHAPVILFSPIGETLTQQSVSEWSTDAILICGRYEGVDQRFIDRYVTRQISLGDFVLSGGEIAAIALLDTVARLQPDVLQNAQSHEQDSFNPAVKGLLDSPHYTRPEQWQGEAVPSVLLSGNHAKIEQWRREQRLALTQTKRPDLLKRVIKSPSSQ